MFGEPLKMRKDSNKKIQRAALSGCRLPYIKKENSSRGIVRWWKCIFECSSHKSCKNAASVQSECQMHFSAVSKPLKFYDLHYFWNGDNRGKIEIRGMTSSQGCLPFLLEPPNGFSNNVRIKSPEAESVGSDWHVEKHSNYLMAITLAHQSQLFLDTNQKISFLIENFQTEFKFMTLEPFQESQAAFEQRHR